MDFIDHMIFVCLCASAVSLVLLAIGGIFELINYISNGRFQEWIINMFSE